MSMQCLKKKGVIQYGSNRSGKPPGGIWVPQGPFGNLPVEYKYGPKGFSLNGGHRNVGYVGKSMAMSKSGTPFWGLHPQGYGGTYGKYKRTEPTFNVTKSLDVKGRQAEFVKQSVLSTKGMLAKKYRWIHSGQYPNYWVQPVYGNSNLSDNASQQVYIQKKAAESICVNDTNDKEVYIDDNDCVKENNDTSCSKVSRNFRRNTYNNIASNTHYSKTLHVAQTSAQQTLQIQKQCANPKGAIKPFPFAVNGGTRSSKNTIGRPNPILTVNYSTPPDWYINS